MFADTREAIVTGRDAVVDVEFAAQELRSAGFRRDKDWKPDEQQTQRDRQMHWFGGHTDTGAVMKRAACWIWVSILCLVLVAGCASTAREAAFRREEVALFEARQQACVRCEPTVDCESAWVRTRAFVTTHSASRIVRADDTLIETALPHSFGFVYLAAPKGRLDEDHALIQLKAMCRGMYRTDGNVSVMYWTCANAIVAVEDEFRAFMSEAK
ncbi:hypothetical protein [Paraburkholderia sp. BR10954]|uniref:hypothetical protein n=1 Tax=Paraburkholderia sp. BR10954 TaxID=3236995 RepID=UPI0034D1A584